MGFIATCIISAVITVFVFIVVDMRHRAAVERLEAKIRKVDTDAIDRVRRAVTLSSKQPATNPPKQEL